MEYVYPIAGAIVGMALIGTSVTAAFVHTAATSSVVDSAIMAFTGVTLQLGDLLAVSSVTAVVFDVLATYLGVQFSLLVPFATGYLCTHVIAYYSSLRITDVQSEPIDPEFDIRETPLRVATLSIPGALLLLPVAGR